MGRRRHLASLRSLARVLHDELIQSLIGTEMCVHAARKRVADAPAAADAELSHVEHIIHEEILKVRTLMQRISPIHLEAGELVDFLADTVVKFRLESGIDARFLGAGTHVSLPSRSCAEIARIVQEGLANARKHAAARSVCVSLTETPDGWSLIIEDDGRGPVATTRVGGASEQWLAPATIKDCVRSLRGELRLRRGDAGGLRLEISVPRSSERRPAPANASRSRIAEPPRAWPEPKALAAPETPAAASLISGVASLGSAEFAGCGVDRS